VIGPSSRGRGLRRFAALSAALALCLAVPIAAAPAASARRALLVSGADAVKGLPFFQPNAIAALTGAYALASVPSGASTLGAERVGLWYTREAIVLDASWKRVDLDGRTAYSLSRGAGSVLCYKEGRFSLFFELGPAAAPGVEAERRAFIKAFLKKFLAFFDNAASDAELSFPAYVDY
jgi:hypothetical protein